MNFTKITLIVLIFVSCKKRQPLNIRFDDSEGPTILIGNVKQVIYGNDKYFDKWGFDKKGDLKYNVGRSYNEWDDDNGKHYNVTNYNYEYKLLYDKAGNKTSMTATIQSSDDSIIHKTKWEFDKNGQAISFMSDLKGPPECTSRYKYDAKGDLIEYLYVRCSHSEPDLHKYKYNSKHLMIEDALYNGDLLLIKNNFSYQNFDLNNNWTKSIKHTQCFPPMQASYRVDTITRKITYY